VALKPTIYKLKIALTDLNRDHYDALTLTIAQHPSETLERMMARVLAFCINAEEHLVFTKGLSDTEEPALWAHTLDGRTSLWIEVGEPAVARLKKASRTASAVKVYSFNTKSGVWWKQARDQIDEIDVSVFQFRWEQINALAAMAQRTMDMSVTITGDSAYIATESGECEVSWVALRDMSVSR